MTHEPAVWTYWEGPCPDYIKLCLESIRRWCNVRVLDRAGFDELWVDDRDLAIDKLYVAHRADFIRVYLLHHFGGTWIDADCIVLRSIAPLASHLATHDVAYYRQPEGSISNNFLMANAQTPVTRSYYESVVAHVRSQRPIAWLEIGSVPLTAAIQSHPNAAHQLKTEAIMPVSWAENQRFLGPVPQQALEDATQGRGRLHDPRAFCYMLSNHSMPGAMKTMTQEEILARPILLNYLFRVARSGAGVRTAAPNYCYWQRGGSTWVTEYDRRKARHAYYHIQEMMITDHIAHHAPCRVLEWGCGTGRHLFNLVQIAGVEAFGLDQSETMVGAGLSWASADWRASHVAVGGPTDRLPYPDGAFDIVFSCEALLHTRPDDLRERLSEIVRVCRGHILHIESPPSWTGYSPSCDGCWGHDFIKAYKEMGHECELLASGFSRQVPYLVRLKPESVRWTWSLAMLSIYRQLDTRLEEGFAQAAVPARA
jgi:SAM-dependent methyltransferase